VLVHSSQFQTILCHCVGCWPPRAAKEEKKGRKGKGQDEKKRKERREGKEAGASECAAIHLLAYLSRP